MRLITTLLLCCVMYPIDAFAQKDFTNNYSGYSWHEVNHFYPAWGAVDMEFLPDGNFLIAQKPGLLTIWTPNGGYVGTALDITDEVCDNGDSGITSILLDPDFPTTPSVYIMYGVDTDPANPDTALDRFGRITKYDLDPSTGYTSIISNSRKVLIGATWSEGILFESQLHCSGMMAWGDDGSLLFSAGDGADFGYKPSASGVFGPGRFDQSLNIRSLRSQSLNCYNGKISRIDRNTGLGLSTNPFYTGNADEPQSRIWTLGLRNPWRFSTRIGSGDHTSFGKGPGILWIGDVGLDSYEEINVSSKEGGENFGWPFYEGPVSPIDQATYDGPIDWLPAAEATSYSIALSHSTEVGPSRPRAIAEGIYAASITAGFFYDYKQLPSFNPNSVPYQTDLDGEYLFAGWAYKQLYKASPNAQDLPQDLEVIASGDLGDEWEGLVHLAYSPYDGHIYALSYWRLYRLEFDAAGAPPVAAVKALPDTGPLPLVATLDGSASTDVAGLGLTYQWNIDDGTSVTTTAPTYEHEFAENRNYQVSLTVADKNDRRSSATVTVYAGNLPPEPVILEPTIGTSYPDDGSPATIRYSGYATDPDSPNPPSTRWRVALRHNDHRHELAATDGLEGEQVVKHEEENTFYLFEFFATDDRGYTVMTDREIYRDSETTQSAVTLWDLYE